MIDRFFWGRPPVLYRCRRLLHFALRDFTPSFCLGVELRAMATENLGIESLFFVPSGNLT
jgi:hypothetical protein